MAGSCICQNNDRALINDNGTLDPTIVMSYTFTPTPA